MSSSIQRLDSRTRLSDREIGLLSREIADRSGLSIGLTRVGFLERRMAERMRARGVAGYPEYYRSLCFDQDRETEWQALLELLVNHESSFFRYPPSFEILEQELIPRRRKDASNRQGNRLRLWSAGCALGQEAYSLALVALAAIGSDEGVSILATDISRRAVEVARVGRYRSRSVSTLDRQLREDYFRERADGDYEIGDVLRGVTRVGLLNLVSPEEYWVEPQDIVFCQNVLIYFDADTRVKVVTRLSERLVPGGFLVLAPGELVGVEIPGVRVLRFDNCSVLQRST